MGLISRIYKELQKFNKEIKLPVNHGLMIWKIVLIRRNTNDQ